VQQAQKDLIGITLAALRNDPKAWMVTRHEAKHEGLGIEVWIANSYYGLKIRGPGVHTPEEPATFTGWLQPWRRAVMRAVFEVGAVELRARYQRLYPSTPSPALRSGGDRE